LHQKQRDGSENHNAHNHVRKTSRFHLREQNTEYKSSENLEIRRRVQQIILVFIQVRLVSSFQLPKMAVKRFLLLLQKQLQIFKLAHSFLLLLLRFSKYFYLSLSLSLPSHARCISETTFCDRFRDCSVYMLFTMCVIMKRKPEFCFFSLFECALLTL